MFYSSNCTKFFIRKNILNKKKRNLILENINISFNTNIIYLIKGKNGSGKTTLINFFEKNINFFNYTKLQLNLVYLVLQLNNKLYLNLINLKEILETSTKFNKLSYGYIKRFLFLLNWSLIKNSYYFDELFNGLDKYFILKSKKLFYYIKLINSNKIKINHLNIFYKNKSIIFLD